MKKIVLVAALATFTLSVFAQGGEKGPFVTNKLTDNIFVSVGGGINLYGGERTRPDLKPGFALDLSVGKWITPAIGARLQYAGVKAGYKPETMGFNFIHADALWNASTTFGGYKPSRRWEFVPFAGAGVAFAKRANAESATTEFGLAAGLLNKVRISDALDANLELRGLLVKQTFDGIVGGSPIEGVASVTVGLSYKFNKRGFDKQVKVAPANYEPYNQKINALESDLKASEARAAQLAKELEAERNKDVVVTTIKGDSEFLLPQTLIFFEVGKTVLSEKEKVNLGYLAAAIKKLPAGTIVKVIGNADFTTGSKALNQRLAKQRAQTVYDALVKAGVEAGKLELSSTADTKDLNSGSPALNRAVFVTE